MFVHGRRAVSTGLAGLLALGGLARAAIAQNEASLPDVFAGSAAPHTIKLKELTPEWRHASISGEMMLGMGGMMQSMMQSIGSMFGGSVSDAIFTRGATLRLRVTNIDGTKLPLANVSVLDGKGKPLASRVSVVSVFRSVMGDQTKKDDSGWREIGNVPPDTYTVIVREKGKPDVSFQRAIRDGETVEWDVDMVKELERRR